MVPIIDYHPDLIDIFRGDYKYIFQCMSMDGKIEKQTFAL